MSSLLSHFDTSEFVEFIGFLAHMTHKLQVGSCSHRQIRQIDIPLGSASWRSRRRPRSS